MTEQKKRLLHHLGTAAGFAFLILWFYAGRRIGFLEWFTALGPGSHAGAMLTLGIMLMMLPGFLIWKFLNRWLESRLQITGRYYEDEAYLKPETDQVTDKNNKDKPGKESKETESDR